MYKMAPESGPCLSPMYRHLPLCVFQGFYRLQALRKLSLSDNEISEIKDDISNITHLVELDISRNGE